MSGVDERSRTAAAADDDGNDHIGFDTPRSGVATPQPDLHDKRLPGIMSYFGQVRPASLQRLLSGTFSATGQAAAAPSPATPLDEEPRHNTSPSHLPVSPVEPASRSPSEDEGPPLLPHEKVALPPEKPLPGSDKLHPYPTPPASQRSSLRGVNMSEASGDQESRGARAPSPRPSPHQKSISDVPNLKARRATLLAPLTKVAVTQSNVHARHFSNPGSRKASTTPSSPICSHASRDDDASASEDRFASIHQLKKLTSVVASKSGQNTPTRSLSTAQPPQVEKQSLSRRQSSAEGSGTQTPTPAGTVPAAKGKLTIKITEAKGLRKSRSPYVVVVFQRSELISGGPRFVEDEDEASVTNAAMGGVPIQRQASDSGRPPMAIPMRSRQSSNTSIGEYNTFRNRTQRRSFTNPTWDAEAAL